MLTNEQKQEAAERGAEWGRQEAALLIEDIENGHSKRWHDWAMGTWCGDLPHEATPSEDRTEAQDAERDEYERILDKAARTAFVAAGEEWEAAQESADEAIQASADSGEIERVPAWKVKPGTISRLEQRSDGRSDTAPTQEREYWGTDGDGDPWRVHLPALEGMNPLYDTK
jgi:hypothetical protein